jgi:hypothetical protein
MSERERVEDSEGMVDLHPREIVELSKPRLDQACSELYKESHQWDRRFGESLSDSERLEMLTVVAAQGLNERWDYKGDYFMVSGTWRRPTSITIDLNINADTDARIGSSLIVDDQVLQIARSEGFKVFADENGMPSVYMDFVMPASAYVKDIAVSGNLDIHAYAKPQDISMNFVRAGVAKTNPIHEGIAQVALEHNWELGGLLRDPERGFYEMQAKDQRLEVLRIIDSASNLVTSPGYATNIELQTPVYYELFGSQLVRTSYEDETELMTVGGELIGFDAFVPPHFGEVPVRKRKLLGDLATGLCFAVALDKETAALFHSDIARVPISDEPLV